MTFLLHASNLSPATVVLKAEGSIRADNCFADFRKALLIVKYGTVPSIRPVGCGNLGIELGGLVRAHNQITTVRKFQLDLPPLPRLDHLAFADSVAALQATKITVGIARKRFTSDSSNAGDDCGHDTSPAQFSMQGVYGFTSSESIEPRYSRRVFA